MSALHINLNRPDDEHLQVQVNGHTASHEAHGWAGMEAVETVVNKIAAAAGVTITETANRDE
jgi:hypothetical protein